MTGKPLTPVQQARRDAQRVESERARGARRHEALSNPDLALFADEDILTPAQALASAIHRQWGHGRPAGAHVRLDVNSAKRLMLAWPLDVDLIRGEGPSDASLLDGSRPEWWIDATSHRASIEELLSFLPKGWRLAQVSSAEVGPREDPDAWSRSLRGH